MRGVGHGPRPPNGEILLGTVAIEPNRWGAIRADRSPETRLDAWRAELLALPIDGLELWEGHLPVVASPGADAVDELFEQVPVRILNTYIGFDHDGAGDRRRVAAAANRVGARAVKFNIGNDPTAEDSYARRLGEWLDDLGDGVVAICECHQHISIAEDPVVAFRILDAAGPSTRAQALVHTHDGVDLIKHKLDALGDRVTHVHVNHLDFSTLTHPKLEAIEDELGQTVDLLRSSGFRGSWTLEFVAGIQTEADHPAALLAQAEADITVLRRLLAPT